MVRKPLNLTMEIFCGVVSARMTVEKIDGVSTNFCLHVGETNFKEAEPHKMFAIACVLLSY
jgi:hypothetical protein